MADVLGVFEQAVLVGVTYLGDEAYGRSILREAERRLAREVAAGAIYATLDRLEAQKFLTSRLEEGTPTRGGRARRYYALTALGKRALNQSRAVLDSIWGGWSSPVGERS